MDQPVPKHGGSCVQGSATKVKADADAPQGIPVPSFKYHADSQTGTEGEQDGNHPVALLLHYPELERVLDASELERKPLRQSEENMCNKCVAFKGVSGQLLENFDKYVGTGSLQESISLLRQNLEHLTVQHQYSATELKSLTDALLAHFMQVSDIDALSEMIRLLRVVLMMCLNGHRGKWLHNLAHALRIYFKQAGDTHALEEAICLHRVALTLHPHSHPDRGILLYNLGIALRMHYKQNGGTDALLEAIDLLREALTLFPSGHSDRGSSLSHLAIALKTQYEESGDVEILAEAISLQRAAVLLHPDGHPGRASSLSNLAIVLRMEHEQSGETDILVEIISLDREALALRPQGHPDRVASLNNLATNLETHYERIGDNDVLEEAIHLYHEALTLLIPGHPDRIMILNNLAGSLHSRYERDGDTDVLAEVIRIHRTALALRPKGHPSRGMSLNNLASALRNHCRRAKDMNALVEMIHLHREALQLRPKGHPDRWVSLNNLALSLTTHYNQEKDPDTLVEAIRLHRESLVLCPQSHPGRVKSLQNLAIALGEQFEQTGSIDMLVEATSLLREVVALLPQGYTHRGRSLNSLANALFDHYEQSGDINMLTESICLYRAVLSLQPQSHPDRGGWLTNLAAALTMHYKQAGGKDTLAEIISLHDEVLALLPRGHPDHGQFLRNLAKSYWARFERDSDGIALAKTLKMWEELLGVLPDGHPDQCEAHHAIARAQLVDSPHFNWTMALNHIIQATLDNGASPRARLQQAIQSLYWVDIVSTRNFEEFFLSKPALNVYIAVIQLLPLAAHAGLDLSTRLRELSGSEQLCHAAAARAMLLQQFQLAIEVFEEGKAVFWSQALRLRSAALDALPASDREKLTRLFQSLEKDVHLYSGDMQDKANNEIQIEHRRQLSKQADALIEEIRMRPGFDRFLKVPQFNELAQAAINGFVVALVAKKPLFFAIIIHVDAAPKHIPLPSVKDNTLRKLCAQFSESEMRGLSHISEATDHEMNRGIAKEKLSARTPLAQVWCTIIQPIILHLGLKRAQGKQRPRIHWCPSGEFSLLPLHAAGIYEGNHQVCAADFVVSSYTPSLSALIKSHEGFTPIPRKELRMLAFGESSAPGQFHIPNVEEEVQTVARIVSSASATVQNDVDAVPTPQSVLDQLPHAHVLHIACHGQQHSDPLQSCFALRDGPLTISALMKIDLPNAMIAFLSACETAKGNQDQPDQAVHLAASMLFCGFRSVVATMWSMYDDDGPRMAQWFYEALLEHEMIDLNDIPYALDMAVQKLRATGAPATRWATFMHMGA